MLHFHSQKKNPGKNQKCDREIQKSVVVLLIANRAISSAVHIHMHTWNHNCCRVRVIPGILLIVIHHYTSNWKAVLEIEIEIAFANINLHSDWMDPRSGKFGVDLDV